MYRGFYISLSLYLYLSIYIPLLYTGTRTREREEEPRDRDRRIQGGRAPHAETDLFAGARRRPIRDGGGGSGGEILTGTFVNISIYFMRKQIFSLEGEGDQYGTEAAAAAEKYSQVMNRSSRLKK